MNEEGHHTAPVSPVEQRVAALEALLTERGLVPEGFIEAITRRYESEIGPLNGAKVVARAWTRPGLQTAAAGRWHRRHRRARLRRRGRRPHGGRGEHPCRAQRNRVHAVLVLSVANAGAAAGLVQGPPVPGQDGPRAQGAAGRDRIARLPGDTEIRVWDSSAEVRYLVLPERPAGTEGMTEAELAGLVTRDSMIGVARL